MLEHTPLTTSSFDGIWDRSSALKVPYNHLIQSINTKYQDGKVFTREGSELDFTLSNIKRKYKFLISGQADRTIVLGASGNLYDATVSLITPILTIAAMSDFSAVTINNRCYITPHDGLNGLANEEVYVYDGTGTARKAAGAGPTNAPTATNSINAGNVEAGLRLFAIAYVTLSGHITKFGPPVEYTGPGSLKVDIGNIQVGDSYVGERWVLATKILVTYNGNPGDQEFFFVPGGNITDNITDTLEVSFFDSELSRSADYLYYQLEEIPAGVCIGMYNNRMVVAGSDSEEETAYISKSGQPESITEDEGLIQVLAGVGGIRNIFQLRSVLYLCKDNRSVAYIDNGDEAITWSTENVDLSNGSSCHGIATPVNEDGKNLLDIVFVANQTGLYAFGGSFAIDEISWKIENIWNRINKAAFHTIEICVNPFNKEICIAVPLDAATSPNEVLYCDYSRGLDKDSVKWSEWFFPITINTINFSLDFTTKKALFEYASTNSYIFDPNARNDFSNAIICSIRTALVGAGYSSQLCHFGQFSAMIAGSGNLQCVAVSINGSVYVCAPITLQANPIGYSFRDILTLDAEKMSVRFRINTLNSWFELTEFTLFAKPSMERRPQV